MIISGGISFEKEEIIPFNSALLQRIDTTQL